MRLCVSCYGGVGRVQALTSTMKMQLTNDVCEGVLNAPATFSANEKEEVVIK